MKEASEKKLNAQQVQAIKHGDGPLLIIAGAGTGKTTVITERIKYLVTSGKAKPSEILALTFTDKASREMEERVDLALPYGYLDMWIATFHSFCDRVLRQEAIHIGLSPNYKLMTSAETIQLLINNLFKFDLNYFRPLGNPTKFVHGLLQHFGRLKDEDISCIEYLKFAKEEMKNTKIIQEEKEKTLELTKAYQTYEEIKIKEGVMDFADLIANNLKLFRTRPNILKQYQEQFKYILVDEFQDTNYAQNQLAILLVGKKRNLNVCADDDQCLPPETKILTPEGNKKIKNIKVGDKVITAIGKGYTSVSKVIHVQNNRKKVRLITFITDKGTKVTTTDNHKMFCFVPPRVYGKKEFYYVYLMYRQGLGWRLGITNDLVQRLRLERSADMIIGIKACQSEQEARYLEALYSLKYCLPTVAFMARKGMAITNEWLEKLYGEFNTESNVQKLAEDLQVDLKAYHYYLSGVVRGNKVRIKVNLRICKRRHRTKWARGRYLISPNVWHEVNLETSDKATIEKIRIAGILLSDTKKGKKIRKAFIELTEAGKFAQKLVEITDGILDIKFDVGKKSGYSRQSIVLPASNVLLGHYIPVFKNFEIVYERVVAIKQKEKLETVYDLEVEKTHNFIANNVVVHNSIYRWRGAAVSNVIQFKKSFPKTKIVVLVQNYRSSQIILDQSYQLIQHNNPDRLEVKEKIDKRLKAVRKTEQKSAEFLYADRVENEAEIVAQKIKELTAKDYSFGNVAILVRANNHAEPFVRALARAGVPCQFLGPGQLFRQNEIRDLIAYLKILYNFEDNVALYRVLSMDFLELNPRDLAAINNFARRQNLCLFEACEAIEKIFVADESKEKIKNFVQMVHRHLGLLPKETAGQILYYFLQDSGWLKKITEYKTLLEEKAAQNISKLFDRLRTYEVDHEDASVRVVVDWLNLSMDLGESPLANNFDWLEEDRVNILTVHSSKGLEFPVVFLVNLVAARFPTRERKEQIPIPEALIKEILPSGDYHQQEERRLFYVGMTRARDRLFLTAADYYGEGKREKKISPFVLEALGKTQQELVKSESASQDKQLSIFDFQPDEEILPQVNYEPQPINYLSYSQMETFKTCPLQYRYRYLQRIPTLPSSAQSFGDTIHRTLKEFCQGIKDGQDLTIEDLLKILSANWSSIGYASKAHEEKMKKRAVSMLEEFFVKFDKKIVLKNLEQSFMIKVSPDLKIGGKIDRVDLKGNKMEIIDYKTGKTMDQKEIDKSLQMTIYALAATDKGTYNQKAENLILTFYFLDSGEKKSTTRTSEELVKAKKEIIQKAKDIQTSLFEPQPGMLCDFCDYKLICKAWS